MLWLAPLALSVLGAAIAEEEQRKPPKTPTGKPMPNLLEVKSRDDEDLSGDPGAPGILVIDGRDKRLTSVKRRAFDSRKEDSPVSGELVVEDCDSGGEEEYLVFADSDDAERYARAKRHDEFVGNLNHPNEKIRNSCISETVSLIGEETLIKWALGQEAWGVTSLTEWVEDGELDVSQELASYNGEEATIEPHDEDYSEGYILLGVSAWAQICDALGFEPEVAYRTN